jgi:hypothetical protein
MQLKYAFSALAARLGRRHHRSESSYRTLNFAGIEKLQLFSQRIAQRLEFGQAHPCTLPRRLREFQRLEQRLALRSHAGGGFEDRKPAALEQIGCGFTIRVAIDHDVPLLIAMRLRLVLAEDAVFQALDLRHDPRLQRLSALQSLSCPVDER